LSRLDDSLALIVGVAIVIAPSDTTEIAVTYDGQ